MFKLGTLFNIAIVSLAILSVAATVVAETTGDSEMPPLVIEITEVR